MRRLAGAIFVGLLLSDLVCFKSSLLGGRMTQENAFKKEFRCGCIEGRYWQHFEIEGRTLKRSKKKRFLVLNSNTN